MAEILKHIVRILIVALFLWFFLRGEDVPEPKIIERVTVDTCYIESTEIIFLDKPDIEILYERDTVLIDSYEPKIKGYKALFPFLYGDVSITGEVLGEVLKMDAKADFKIPQITNTIEREYHYPSKKGFEIWGVGTSSLRVGLDVEKGKNKFGYRYNPNAVNRNKHELTYGRLLFTIGGK